MPVLNDAADLSLSGGDYPNVESVYLGTQYIWPAWGPPERMIDVDPKSSLSTLGITCGSNFTVTAAGRITHFRYYAYGAGTQTLNLWDTVTHAVLATASDASPGEGWREVPLPTPFEVIAGGRYTASYFSTVGYVFTSWAANSNSPHMTIQSGCSAGTNSFPDYVEVDRQYHIDVVYQQDMFTPRSLHNLIGWYDDNSYFIYGDVGLEQWSDRSGLDNHLLQPTASGQPVASYVQGKQGGRFNGTGQWMTCAGLSTPLNGETSYTVFGVFKGGALASRFLWGTNPAATSRGSGWYSAADAAWGPQERMLAATAPTTPTSGLADYTVGTFFKSSVPGRVTHIRYYAPGAGPYRLSLWHDDRPLGGAGVLVGRVEDVAPGSGWREVALGSPIVLNVAYQYCTSYSGPDLGYTSALPPSLAPHLTVLSSGYVQSNDYLPYQDAGTLQYHADVIFQESLPDAVTLSFRSFNSIDSAGYGSPGSTPPFCTYDRNTTIVAQTWDTTTRLIKWKRNGGPVGTSFLGSAPLVPVAGGFALGARYSSGASFFDGEWCEFIVCAGVLSAAQIAQTEKYLLAKWRSPLLPPPPTLTSVVPNTMPKSSASSGGVLLTITGTGFVPNLSDTSVGLIDPVTGYMHSNSPISVTSTQITMYHPANASAVGVHRLRAEVFSGGRQSDTSNELTITVT